MRVALHTVLLPGRGPDYDRIHEHIPDEVAAALAAAGVHDWQIWRDGEHVFHLVDVDDYDRMRAALRDLPANLAWQDTVGPLFAVPDGYDEESDTAISPVWSLQAQRARSVE